MVNLFMVGGAVRDGLLGVKSKDIDFTVEAESFEAMTAHLESEGFNIFLSTPEYLTIRARFPKGDFEFAGERMGGTTCDFVLARKDGEYTDGRRPDTVTAGTIYDDLARRDFTVNAIAMDSQGNLIDPHEGQVDLKAGMLRTVGEPMDRLTEDALRAIRAIRFSVTKGLQIDGRLWAALRSPEVAYLLGQTSTDRVREELTKCFKHDTFQTLAMLNAVPMIRKTIFDGGAIWLKPTTES